MADVQSTAELDDLGPIDYIVVEWPGRQPRGEVAPLILDLAERGLIRIIDLAFVTKGDDGSVAALDLAEIEDDAFREFEGASSGVMGPSDLEEAANALEPGTSAAVFVWENRWAAPVAAGIRRSGGQLVASGRIPVQALIASLDAAEAVS